MEDGCPRSGEKLYDGHKFSTVTSNILSRFRNPNSKSCTEDWELKKIQFEDPRVLDLLIGDTL